MQNHPRRWRRNLLCAALGFAVATLALPKAHADNTNGSVVGHTTAGARVTVTNTGTGFTRTVVSDADGGYRFPFLPVGSYRLSVSRNGAPVGQPVPVTVTLGNATTVNVGGATAAKQLEAVNVSGSVLPVVDVTSTETATNINRAQLQRLPVAQSVSSVALLAPGVVRGNAGFGGISFGGSSIAENAFYVNGLNVTDFYNRNGFSEAPYAFYQEFQVKTGGYSVEFGRTTGGVVNAVARSGTNEPKAGVEITLDPENWQSVPQNRYNPDGSRYITASRDRSGLVKTNVYASGPIVKDKLFIFAMYEARGATSRNTNDQGNQITDSTARNGFWGTTIDWNITDANILSLMAFSDQDHSVADVYGYDYASNTFGPKSNTVFNDTGGRNGALTYTSYLTDNLSMKLMVGRNQRRADTGSPLDGDCNYVTATNQILAVNDPGVPLGCTTSSTVYHRKDTRDQARADFEWKLSDHLLRFGFDHEKDTSQVASYYAGPGAFYYNVYAADPGDRLPNNGVLPAGYQGYVRQRRYEISGNFPTINSAYYLEDNWQVSPNWVLNLGVRNDSFDNQDADKRSYIKIKKQIAPRFGFSWDMKGDASMKLFGNLGRYYLPVANVINIKQGGGLLDQRTYYAFNGWTTLNRDGVAYAIPNLGPQVGPVDVSQGDGTVGDLRSEVDKHMDPVYQDEAILGFQQLLTPQWSWGVRGIYRRLHNAIDDMNITATAQCGGDGAIGYVVANPGRKVTVYGDTNCDGVPDGYVDVDTSKEGFALYDADGNYLGQRGWRKPKRTYSALELQLDRAWDSKWSLNASYTLSYSRGNAEGPVDSDTDFSDTGRTENFDDPWVNLGGGFLPNDRRHQFKARGTYAITPHWEVAGDLDVHSGSPVTGFGVGNPYDATNYHSYFICVDQCDAPRSEDRVYKASTRGAYGRTPWITTLNGSLSYLTAFRGGDMRIKLSVYNLLNQQRTTTVDQDLQTTIGYGTSDTFRQPIGFQPPRYTELTFSVNF